MFSAPGTDFYPRSRSHGPDFKLKQRVPLATTKIIRDRIGPLMAIGHFLGGEARG